MAPHWTQTTPALLAASDLVVFLEPACYQACAAWVERPPPASEVWEIPDVGDPRFPDQQAAPGEELQIMAMTERTFARLQHAVAAFVTQYTASAVGGARRA
jgi:hypothetical protein